MKTSTLYEAVTQSIIAELKNGTIPWLKPWKYGNSGSLPANALTKRSYSGINICILWFEADRNGYPFPLWLTYRQATSLGATVRKGERGTHIVFAKKLPIETPEPDIQKTVQLLRTFCVFNVAQVDGLPAMNESAFPQEHDRHLAAEDFIKATGADVRLGGDRACYIPSLDRVLMPFQGFFNEAAAFYSVTLHELGHWSGAKHRLDRDLCGTMGSPEYAFEELIAELTSAFLSAHLGIKAELRHAGYIEHYLTALRSDNRAFFKAAAKAQQAADYLRSFSEANKL